MVNGTVTIIGAGNMGGALLKGLWSSDKFVKDKMIVIDPNHDRLESFTSLTGVTRSTNISSEIAKSKIIILAIKPQELLKISPQLKNNIPKSSIVISVLAGVSISTLKYNLGNGVRVARAMPNIAASVLCSTSVVAFSDNHDEELAELAQLVFRQIGEVYVSSEDTLNAVTGLSGSGPAYIYMVIESLADGGVKVGLPRDLSLKLATQTVLGAAEHLKQSKLHPAILKDQVTTPGGSTISAIHELEKHGLRSMLISAVVTATEKTNVLGKTIDKILNGNKEGS